jgi:hypothetical protein
MHIQMMFHRCFGNGTDRCRKSEQAPLTQAELRSDTGAKWNSGLVTAIIAEMGGPIMTTGYGNTSLAIKVGYYVLAAGVAVFVGMLIMTAYP